MGAATAAPNSKHGSKTIRMLLRLMAIAAFGRSGRFVLLFQLKMTSPAADVEGVYLGVENGWIVGLRILAVAIKTVPLGALNVRVVTRLAVEPAGMFCMVERDARLLLGHLVDHNLGGRVARENHGGRKGGSYEKCQGKNQDLSVHLFSSSFEIRVALSNLFPTRP